MRSKFIDFRNLRGWYAKKYAAPVPQISYIGYDEVDNTKELAANCGQEYTIPIHLWSTFLKKYHPSGYHRDLLIPTACCIPCADNCDLVDQEVLAAGIKEQIEADAELMYYISTVEIVTTVLNAGDPENERTIGWSEDGTEFEVRNVG